MALRLFTAAAAGMLSLPVAHAAPVEAVAEGEMSVMAKDAISSCGNAWMPRDDVSIGQGTDTRRGYSTAVNDFCSAANGQVVKAGGYLSMASEVFINGGKAPATYGILGFVYFEVHNKLSSDHTISTASCKTYLNALSADGGQCSGATNKDTKGGTWQVGDNGVSYHALGQKLPPKQDALNKLISGVVLESQSINRGGSAPLNLWPLALKSAIKPTTCHSHNDYDQESPLWGALAAGCVGLEADVWWFLNELTIGHILPTPGRTLKAQYIDPIRAILDFNNGGSPGPNGLYKSRPTQSVSLLIDFKTGGADTLAAVVKALQPLRDGGYLSRVEGGKFVEKAITVVASGSANFGDMPAGSADVFFDAKVDYWDANFKSTNSHYASADFQDAIGNPGSVEAFTAEMRGKVASQVKNAKGAGLKVRYYNLPGTYLWEPLAALGVDRLNADDMSETARLPRL